MNDPRFVLQMKKVKIFFWATNIVFLFIFVAGLLNRHIFATLVGLFFLLLNIYGVLILGEITIDRYSITSKAYLCFRINWDEVLEVELDLQRGSIVFRGNRKQLALIGPMYWFGTEGQAMLKFVEEELLQRNIPMKITQKALYRISKNTRIKN